MALDKHALSSLSASLDELINRIGEVAREADSEDEAMVDVLEVERQLTTAGRRLEKIVHRLGR